MSRNATGEGSVFRRKDGRWVGTVFVDTVSGKRKRIYLYGKTRAEVHEALAERIRAARRGIRTPDQTWTIGRYLTYWIDEVSGARNRPRTTEEYHRLAQNHLAGIGHHTFASLTPTRLQEYLNDKLARGTGARTIEAARALLRAALSHAERQWAAG